MNSKGNKQNIAKPIYMDAAGKKHLIMEIKKLEERLEMVNKQPIDRIPVGSWLDTDIDGTFIAKDQEIAVINNQLDDYRRQEKNVTSIQKHNIEDAVDINDTIRAYLKGGVEDGEIVFRLVAGLPDIFAEISELSLECPIGNAVYGQKIGSTLEYVVVDEKLNTKTKYTITILEKLNKELTR